MRAKAVPTLHSPPINKELLLHVGATIGAGLFY